METTKTSYVSVPEEETEEVELVEPGEEGFELEYEGEIDLEGWDELDEFDDFEFVEEEGI